VEHFCSSVLAQCERKYRVNRHGRGRMKKDGAAQVIRSEYGGQRAITYVRGNGSGHISYRGARPVDTKDISHGSFPFAI
jgi:hypothetical protein